MWLSGRARAGVPGGSGRNLLIDHFDLLLQQGLDIVRWIEAQKFRETLAGHGQRAPAQGSRGAEEERLAGFRIQRECLFDEAPGTPVELRFITEGQRLRLSDQRIGILAAGQPVRALKGAHRELILLQNRVRAAQHQPAVEILWILLEPARQPCNHRLGTIVGGFRLPRPVRPPDVQHG